MPRTKRTVRLAVIIVVLSSVASGCSAFIDYHQLRVIKAQETAWHEDGDELRLAALGASTACPGSGGDGRGRGHRPRPPARPATAREPPGRARRPGCAGPSRWHPPGRGGRRIPRRGDGGAGRSGRFGRHRRHGAGGGLDRDDAFFVSDNATLGASNTAFNDDGTFTVHFGAADVVGDQPNRLDISDGWSFLFRIYQPGQEVLDRQYVLPDVVEHTP